jgi:hypothetical protein
VFHDHFFCPSACGRPISHGVHPTALRCGWCFQHQFYSDYAQCKILASTRLLACPEQTHKQLRFVSNQVECLHGHENHDPRGCKPRELVFQLHLLSRMLRNQQKGPVLSKVIVIIIFINLIKYYIIQKNRISKQICPPLPQRY